MGPGTRPRTGPANTRGSSEKLGFATGAASPCSFHHAAKELYITVHGDDFTVTGPTTALKWLEDNMSNKYDIKAQVLGPEWNMQQSMTVLNRTMRWQEHGIEYEPDQRHAELIIESMGVSSGKGVSTPVVADSLQDPASRMHSAELCSTEASRYRAVAARLNYLAQDRFELQFAAKVASKSMSCPQRGRLADTKESCEIPRSVPKICANVWMAADGQCYCYPY